MASIRFYDCVTREADLPKDPRRENWAQKTHAALKWKLAETMVAFCGQQAPGTAELTDIVKSSVLPGTSCEDWSPVICRSKRDLCIHVCGQLFELTRHAPGQRATGVNDRRNETVSDS
ncbi:hypothetical protein Bbelb_067650 [Branchiostoma belcheri]|nr:hypothetical protein Bbelb_067650 [Branchiostoma belcheri]